MCLRRRISLYSNRTLQQQQNSLFIVTHQRSSLFTASRIHKSSKNHHQQQQQMSYNFQTVPLDGMFGGGGGFATQSVGMSRIDFGGGGLDSIGGGMNFMSNMQQFGGAEEVDDNSNHNTAPVSPYVDQDTEEMALKAFDYDLFVIGGGSGGISAAKAAAKFNKRVGLCDFVRPSTQGTTWGLGGTCVNVGCIPKKLFHTAALHGETVHHASAYYGWGGEPVEEYNEKFEIVHPRVPTANWARLRQNVLDHIGSLNWGYTSELSKNNVQYHNAFAKFSDVNNDKHTLELTDANGNVSIVTARRILIATGGRPTLLPIPGAKEYAITSDDLFSQAKPPGKTLFVGASYVSLECAGFVHGLGFEGTSVMMRSIPLRGFDVDMANRVVKAMEDRGIKFIRNAQPTKIEKSASEEGKFDVTYTVATTSFTGETTTSEHVETFDTVCLAVGRKPEVDLINLHLTGVSLSPKSGKILVNAGEQTNVLHIYAIGDIIEGGLELTPVAIKAGKLLADRLYNKKTEVLKYKNVPTTVFTPLEYGCVGLSEEEAIKQFVRGGSDDASLTAGANNFSDDPSVGGGVIEVYHTAFTPLEWNLPHFRTNECYMKLIVNKSDHNRVVGFHILSPNAGEIVQGVAVAMRARVTKDDFDDTIGIHPTIAEDMTLLRVTRSSGEDANKAGC